jgi:hypothetical protein
MRILFFKRICRTQASHQQQPAEHTLHMSTCPAAARGG